MAITFVGSATNFVRNGSTLTLSLSGIALNEGDIVLAFGVGSGGGTPAHPSGYTAIDTVSSASLDAALSYKIQTSSVDTSLSFFDVGSSTDVGAAIAMAFRGVDQSTPQDVTTEETITSHNPPSITPASNNCCIVIFGGADNDDSSVGTVTSYTQPTPHTVAAGDSDEDITVAAAYRILSGGAASAENPADWSTWGTSSNNCAYTVALRPAAEAGQPFYLRDIIQIPSGGISII